MRCARSGAISIAGGLDRRALIAALAAGALGPLSARPAAAASESGSTAAVLARGVNLSHWFAQSFAGYGAHHLATFVTDDDLKRLREAGLTHVRLGVEPDILFSAGARLDREQPILRQLRLALDRIAANGLAVVVDLHPVGHAKDGLLTEDGARLFVDRWSQLAGILAREPGPDLVLEILNEPEPAKGAAWWTLQGRALDAIRAAGAAMPVIVNGGGWSGVDDLVAQAPYPDRNLVYTIHHYAPILFTHQGADWTWDVARSVSGLGWPLSPEQAETSAAAAASDDRARGFVRDAVKAGTFTQAALASSFDRLSAWAASHGEPPIYVGEFGVYAKAAPAEARLAWLRAAREQFERRGWGWALWDDSPEFGLRPAGKPGGLDPGMLRALGIGA